MERKVCKLEAEQNALRMGESVLEARLIIAKSIVKQYESDLQIIRAYFQTLLSLCHPPTQASALLDQIFQRALVFQGRDVVSGNCIVQRRTTLKVGLCEATMSMLLETLQISSPQDI